MANAYYVIYYFIGYEDLITLLTSWC